MSNTALSNIPDLTRSVCVPRLAAIEYPFGMTMGKPGDRQQQTAILKSALQALEDIKAPGDEVNLPLPGTSRSPIGSFTPCNHLQL